MKLQQFLVIAAIVGVLFGIGLLLFPAEMAATYGTSLTPGGTIMARIAGSSLIALAIITYSARDRKGPEMLRGVLTGGLVTNALDLLIVGQATMAGVVGNTVGWATVVLHLLLGAGFAYYLSGKR